MNNHKLYDTYVEILRTELVMALGCTEPIAIALAGAKVRQVLGCMPERIQVDCSGNVVKNVKGVTVPHSGGRKGIEAAAVLGVVAGKAEAELEVLQFVTEEHLAELAQLLEQKDFCKCELIENVENLYIVITAWAGEHSASVAIKDRHTNIVNITKDGQVLYAQADEERQLSGADKSLLSVRNILHFADEIELEKISQIIETQIQANSAIAKEGLSGDYGASVGKTLLQFYGDDIKTRAKAAAAAGSDARMSGCALPVVINSGSGNQGMTVSLPVIEYAKELKASQEKLIRALAVSNLVSILQKRYIGSLSAYCGAVSAACGSGAGIAYLYGASYEQICQTIVNTLANVGGIVCDGAKPSCAAKIASSVDAAIMGYMLTLVGKGFEPGEGIVKDDIEDTIRAIGHIGKDGMHATDLEILRIMLQE